MIALRKSHPSISRSRFWREDVHWYGVGNIPDLSLNSHTLAYCLHGASQNDNDLYVMINAYWEDLTFAVQEGEPNDWYRIIDTGLLSPLDFCDAKYAEALKNRSYSVKARSIVVLLGNKSQTN
jgi:glycogen operon protein